MKPENHCAIGSINVIVSESGLIWCLDPCGAIPRIIGCVLDGMPSSFRTLDDLEKTKRIDVIFPR
jgi:hypothetical protein